MDTKKILSADLLDIIFDDRNKDYGAYELRKTYDRRVIKSLVFTGSLVLIAITSFSFINKINKNRAESTRYTLTTQVIQEIEKTPPVDPPKKIDPPKTRTEKFTDKIVIAKPNETPDPPPTVDDLDKSAISNIKTDGPDDQGAIPGPAPIDNRNGIIDQPTPKEPEIRMIVQVEAKFTGDWTKFLLRNLRGNIPIDNGAPAGRYTVMIQFVVSLDGSVSDIKPLTDHGYGMEDEAIRVLKKADKWEPAIQEGRTVKSYRRQPITFIVEGEN